MFGNWAVPSEDTIEVVEDPTNPAGSGQALRFKYLTTADGAGEATADTFPGGPYRVLYVLMRIFMEESGWDAFGNKFFYLGAALNARANVGSPTQYYNDRTGGAPFRLVNQNIGSVVVTRSDRPPPEGGSIAFPGWDQWITLEHLLVAESTPGAGDGRGATWINGQPAGDRSDVTWIPAGAPANGFTGMHYYAHVNDVPVESYYRLGELYIAGEPF